MGQLQKSSSLQNFATNCLMCSLAHMPKPKPYQETSFSTSTEHHKHLTQKAFLDTAPKVSPPPRTAHSGAGSTRSSPAFPSPAAQTPLHSHLQPCSVPLSLPTPLPGAIPVAKGMGQQHQAEIRALACHPSSTNTLLGDAGCGPALPQFPQLPFERY